MATMNISLTDDLKQFVDEQVAEHAYASTSEYLRDLIMHLRQESVRDHAMEKLLGMVEALELVAK